MARTCTRCNVEKALDEYSRDVKAPDGLRKYCRACAAAYDRAYRSAHGAIVRKAYKRTEVGRLHRKAERHRRRARSTAGGPLTRQTLEAVMSVNRAAYSRLTCVYCKKDVEQDNWHLEHLTPLARGGTNDASNLAVSCPPCNLAKGVSSYADTPRYEEEHLFVEDLTYHIRMLHALADRYGLDYS